MTNPVVGHKTFYEPSTGQFRHEPLRKDEADKLLEQIEAEERLRKERYPDEKSAIQGLWDAQARLKEMGWKEALYAPADRDKQIEILELGSTGIHKGFCEKREGRGDKWFWITGDGDMLPSTPILFRELRNA